MFDGRKEEEICRLLLPFLAGHRSSLLEHCYPTACSPYCSLSLGGQGLSMATSILLSLDAQFDLERDTPPLLTSLTSCWPGNTQFTVGLSVP